jgi:hypothetical protein
VTPLTGLAYLLKPGFFEGFDKAHKATTRGIRIDRVGFHDSTSISRGMVNGRQKQHFGNPEAPIRSLHEETGQ